MADLSVWHWAVLVAWLSTLYPAGIVAKRLGFSPLAGVVFIVPLVWVPALWALAFRPWPGVNRDYAEPFR